MSEEQFAQLVYGTTTFDLMRVTDEDISIPRMGGIGRSQFAVHQLENTADIGDMLFTERWSLVMRARRTDRLADRIRKLIRILRHAWRFQNSQFQTTQVYLKARSTRETNFRYAIVHSSPDFSGPTPMFDLAMDQVGIIEELGVSISRYAWRALQPGALPAAVCMTSPKVVGVTIGPEKVLNPGFETAGTGGADVFANWIEAIGTGAIVRTNTGAEVHSGTWACKITCGATPYDTSISQYFTVTPGKTYDFSIWMRGDATHGGITLIYDNTPGIPAWVALKQFNGPTGATYAQSTWRFTAPPGCTSIAAIGYPGATNTWWACWDDVSLKEVTDQPCSTVVQIGNFKDTVSVTHIFRYDDSAATYSANLVGQASISLFPAATAANDALLIGSTDGPLHDVLIPIAVPASMIATALVQIWTGAAFVTLSAGIEYTAYPLIGASLFSSVGNWVINVFNKAGWAANLLNGVTAWWIKITLNPFTSMATIPVTSATQTIGAIHDPSIEIPATSLKGDIPTMVNLRLLAPYGAGATDRPGLISRILVGAKGRGLTNFISHLNLGNAGNPAMWATAYGTDTTASSAGDGGAQSPQGVYSNCTFATDATLLVRATLTGTAMMPDYEGRYRVFVVCAQAGGVAGDVSVMVRFRLVDTATYRPKFDTPLVATKSINAYWEAVDCGTVRLPMIEETSADFLGSNLLIQLLASRAGGASTIYLSSIILLPIDEWSTTLDDPVSDPVTGPSALRGLTGLDVDGGIINTRCSKFEVTSAGWVLAEMWYRDGQPPLLEPARLTRLYFMMLHYPTTMGTGPMLIRQGSQLAALVYTCARYLYLRGDD